MLVAPADCHDPHLYPSEADHVHAGDSCYYDASHGRGPLCCGANGQTYVSQCTYPNPALHYSLCCNVGTACVVTQVTDNSYDAACGASNEHLC